MGIGGCKAILVAYRRALADGVPVVGLWHSGGARLREGVESLHAVGEVFAIMTRVSGKIPQISVVLGPAAGGAAYGPALTDVVVLGPEGRIFVTGPDVVRSVTGEDVDMLRLGGPEPHGRRSGVVHVISASERAAMDDGARLANLLGTHGTLDTAAVTDSDLAALLPGEPQAGLRRAPARRRHPRRRLGARAAREVGAQRRHHPRPPRRSRGRRHRQQPAAPRRLPRRDERREGLAVRAHVRRVRPAARRRRRRARLPPRRRPGVGRRRTPWRQAAARVRRGVRARASPSSPARPSAAPTSR